MIKRLPLKEDVASLNVDFLEDALEDPSNRLLDAEACQVNLSRLLYCSDRSAARKNSELVRIPSSST